MSGDKDLIIRHFDGSLPEDREGQGGETMNVAIVAMESKGKNPRHAKIVELAIVLLEVERESGKFLCVTDAKQWFQDPEEEEPFTEAFSAKTGITAEMVAGQAIDTQAFEDLAHSAEVIIGFNAGFIRPILQQQFPSLNESIFACVRNQIDWSAKGHESRSLFHLTRDHLWYCDEQRTMEQCGTLLKLLNNDLNLDGEDAGYLKELIDRAQEPLITIEARVDMHQKHLMKKERFHWDNRERIYQRVMGTSTLDRVRRSLDARGFTGELIERDRLPASDRFK
jgi:DNA polymerase III epsilon subunit-like protein